MNLRYWILSLVLCFSLAIHFATARKWSAPTPASPELLSANPLTGPLFKRSANGSPDTLEVFVIYVDFQEESDRDDETTTGRGTFGSSEDKNEYRLAPFQNGETQHEFYLKKHFEFARNYFQTVSRGRLYIADPRIFPKPDGSTGFVEPFTLRLPMKAYNPFEQDDEEPLADFRERRAEAIMTFVSEAIRAADASEREEENPFLAPFNESPNRARAFMIFHAGHSRLVDGGALGPLNADTPADFTDFFITKPDFQFLKTLPEEDAKRGDTLGVPTKGDTLTEVMMLSESASQDGITWGINGILVNQLAQQLGMPNTFDVGQGGSQLGYFDLMDWAGYNAMNGFVPVYPMAWIRSYMGWEEPTVARIGDSQVSEYSIASPLVPGANQITSLQVPINEREYLLIENRQRTLGDSVTIYFSKKENENDRKFSIPDSITIPFDFIDSVFLDSLCDKDGENCAQNERQPQGIVTGASTYDLGLPGSGLLVWHINEWWIELLLRTKAVNAYLNDTLRNQYLGIALMEADGDRAIGKRFTDVLGQDVFDFGSGSDMFPHWVKYLDDPPEDSIWLLDTVTLLTPYGFANTNAWNDGRTHVGLEFPLPDTEKLHKGVSQLRGDSTFTFRDTSLTVRVLWPDNEVLQVKPGSQWPISIPISTHPQSILGLNGLGEETYLFSVSDSGHSQLFTASGAPAIEVTDTLRNPIRYDSAFTLFGDTSAVDTSFVPLSLLGEPVGAPLGAAVLEDSIPIVLTREALYIYRLNADSLASDSVTANSTFARNTASRPFRAGPMVLQERLWAVSSEALLAFDATGALHDSISLPAREYHSLAGWETDGGAFIGLAAREGKLVLVDLEKRSAAELALNWGSRNLGSERFSVTASDFDRDGSMDLFLLGSGGSAHLVQATGENAGEAFPRFPLTFPRSVSLQDTARKDTYQTRDPSAPSVGDINQDGYPDLIFSGTNGIYAVDYRGASLSGWPFLFETKQPVGFLYANRQFPSSVVASTPLITSFSNQPVVLTASPDGLIWALQGDGSPVEGSSVSKDQLDRMGLQSTQSNDWPLSVGGLNTDTTDVPFIHLHLLQADGNDDLELFAQTGTGTISQWSLKQARMAGGMDWGMPGGNFARTQFFDASQLKVPEERQLTESIQKFYLYPSPLTGPMADVYLQIGAPAKKARLRIYDLAGNVVKDQSWGALTAGVQPENMAVDLKHLGPDVYAAMMEVWFEGRKQRKWERFGVIR